MEDRETAEIDPRPLRESLVDKIAASATTSARPARWLPPSGRCTASSSTRPGASLRYTSGTLPTRYTYTGQYSYASDFGLVFYGSRFYDPLLARWASPNSIIPQGQGTLAWDRYSYVNNSPVNYTDPTGHMVDDGCSTEGCDSWTNLSKNQRDTYKDYRDCGYHWYGNKYG